MRLPREPFSWDGDDDLPVPLDGLGSSDSPEPTPAGEVLAVAESVVRDAQEAISRQDTDPNVILAEHARGRPRSNEPRARERFQPRLSRAHRAALLSLGCALAFAHGWGVGATADASPSSCDRHHCSQGDER